MSKTLRFLFLTLMLVIPVQVFAQGAAPVNTPEVPKVDETAVKELIQTLESETGRNEFISNLKLLLDQQSKNVTPEENMAPLTQALGVETLTGGLVDKYQLFLARNNLKGSTVGKIGLTLGATLAAIILIFISRRGVTRILKLVDRMVTWLQMPPMRLRLYGRVLRMIATVGLVGLVGLLTYSYFLIWAVSKNNPFEAEWFKTILKLVFNVGFVIILAALFWEIINTTLHVVFKRLDGENSTRAQTIMPIVRNVLFIVFTVLFLLVLLSEIGINIMPLLAGAGIVGVAIGFGAQTMVKDFITGFTIILEDVVRVGDVAKVAGHEGTVEKITLRKMQLRDAGGRVYTVPFSEITTIENATKDFSFYTLDIGVSYSENTDRVCDVLREISSTMLADPVYAADMLEPIEIFGVDRFADSAVIIKARLKTQPLRQWVVGREFNRRMKMAFDTKGIEIPFPQRVVTVKGDKSVQGI